MFESLNIILAGRIQQVKFLPLLLANSSRVSFIDSQAIINTGDACKEEQDDAQGDISAVFPVNACIIDVECRGSQERGRLPEEENKPERTEGHDDPGAVEHATK